MINYKKIYENSFNIMEYNIHDEFEFRFQYVLKFIKEKNINKILDVGSGRGTLLKVIKDFDENIDLTSSDLKKFHNYDIPFVEVNLCHEDDSFPFFGKNFELLTCLDVLEHLEKECIDSILGEFSKISNYSIFTIANHSDKLNGVELHLIQENIDFWRPKIEQYFEILDFKEHYGGRLMLLTLKSIKK